MKLSTHWQTVSKRVTVLFATWIKHALFSPLMRESTVRISDACARPSIADVIASHHHMMISQMTLLIGMRAQDNDLWNHAILPVHFSCNQVLRTWYVPFTAIRPELRGVTLHRLLMNNAGDFVTLPHNLLLQVCLNIPFRHTVMLMTSLTGVVKIR